MVLRARVGEPQADYDLSYWPQASIGEFPSSALSTRDRRFEAESFLKGGYGIRLSLLAHAGVRTFASLARAWQPNRLKGIQLSKEFGTPFLAATQVLDIRPTPRKFLSLERTSSAEGRFLKSGEILVTCSGSVGKATLAYDAHAGILISHDLLRIEPRDPRHTGWLYAFLRSEQAFAMMSSAQYGHVIKHLETTHLDSLPIPLVSPELQAYFKGRVAEILRCRNDAWQSLRDAEALFEDALGPADPPEASGGFEVSVDHFSKGRRRLEASYHTPGVTSLLARFAKAAVSVEPLEAVASGVYWLGRFKRVFGDSGTPYLSADDLFTTNPTITKHVLEVTSELKQYYVKEGWLMIACSGQTYGMNGSVALMTAAHEQYFFSHDLIRVVPNPDLVRAGYLFVALGHPTLGRPLLIRNAYGTSIPHLDPSDVARTPIPRLPKEVEAEISKLAERSATLRAAADLIENEISAEATALTSAFMCGESESFEIS